MKTKTFGEFLRYRVASGKPFFLKEEAMANLGLDSSGFNVIASRFAKEKLIKYLSHGFFVIISDARSHFGLPYISEFLDKYMGHINVKYYVSLLSAVTWYGSAHQQPQLFQVITDKHTKNIIFDKITISFYSLAHRFASSRYKSSDTGYGCFNLATVEQVCIDLVSFFEECGYWNNVCTIIGDLAKECDTQELVGLIPYVKTADLQRLGYIFEFIAETRNEKCYKDPVLAQTIKQELGKRKTYYIPLSPSEPLEMVKNTKWKLIINDIIEPDL